MRVYGLEEDGHFGMVVFENQEEEQVLIAIAMNVIMASSIPLVTETDETGEYVYVDLSIQEGVLH